MNSYLTKNIKILIAKTFLLSTILLFILPCCRKKDQPQQSRQATVSQETEQITVSKPAKLPEPVEKIDLRILYAGLLDTERAKDFTDFFNRHFEQVETIDLYKFTESLAADFDVAVIDHNGVGFNVKLPAIPPDYSRATVTMGVPGAFICSRLSLKTSYL